MIIKVKATLAPENISSSRLRRRRSMIQQWSIPTRSGKIWFVSLFIMKCIWHSLVLQIVIRSRTILLWRPNDKPWSIPTRSGKIWFKSLLIMNWNWHSLVLQIVIRSGIILLWRSNSGACLWAAWLISVSIHFFTIRSGLVSSNDSTFSLDLFWVDVWLNFLHHHVSRLCFSHNLQIHPLWMPSLALYELRPLTRHQSACRSMSWRHTVTT